MKRKMMTIVVAAIMIAVVLGYGLFKIVEHSNNYEIAVRLVIDETQVQSYTLYAGQTMIVPKDYSISTKAGYKFCGWYADPEFSKEFNFGQKLRHDTIIYAKWEKLATEE